MYFVYMIKNAADELYVGVTENPQHRLAYHNEKTRRTVYETLLDLRYRIFGRALFPLRRASA